MEAEESTPVAMMLARLDKVRKNGKRGWVARCPSHEDKQVSLSVCEGAGGKVLLNCFAGCSALDVVQSLGMTLAELFPRKLNSKMTREEQIELHEQVMRTKWAAALDMLDRESFVVYMVAQKVKKGQPLDDNTMQRFTKAVEKIENARLILKTGPSRKRLDHAFNFNRAKTGERK